MAKESSFNSYSSYMSLTLDDAALHGLPGDVVRAIGPHSEADPAALLASFLTMLGNACGPGPVVQVGADAHPGRLFVMLVGDTTTGRKGTAGSQITRLFDLALPDWTASRLERGIQSAEAVIARVADGRDRRLMLMEFEMGRLLATMAVRPTLPSVLKEAWDGAALSVVTKRHAIRVRAGLAHVSVLGHITPSELGDRMAPVDVQSGTANRWLYFVVNRSKMLPMGGDVPPDVLDELAVRVEDTVSFAREYSLGRLDPVSQELCRFHGVFPQVPLERSRGFERAWEVLYRGEFERRLPGTAGVVTARVAAQVLRVAVVYALSDQTDTVDVSHLEAAMAVWRYNVESVKQVFGTLTGDRNADRVLRALHEAPLSRTDISILFSRNKTRRQLDEIISTVMETGLVRRYSEGNGVRKTEMYTMVKEAGEGSGRVKGRDRQ